MVPAVNAVFDDPCPTVRKSLQFGYRLVAARAGPVLSRMPSRCARSRHTCTCAGANLLWTQAPILSQSLRPRSCRRHRQSPAHLLLCAARRRRRGRRHPRLVHGPPAQHRPVPNRLLLARLCHPMRKPPRCGGRTVSCGRPRPAFPTSARRASQVGAASQDDCWRRSPMMPLCCNTRFACTAAANKQPIPTYPAKYNVRDYGAKGDGRAGEHGQPSSTACVVAALQRQEKINALHVQTTPVRS